MKKGSQKIVSPSPSLANIVSPARFSSPTFLNEKSSELINLIKNSYPNLKVKMELAAMTESVDDFIKKILISSTFISFFLSFLLVLFLNSVYPPIINFEKMNWNPAIGYTVVFILLFFILLFFFFNYFMFLPDVKIIKRVRQIDYNLVFAGRHLLIALKSGLPLFDSLLGLTSGYGEVSIEFKKIVEKITLGMPPNQAMKEVATKNPSMAFRRIIFQLVNAMSSGSDLTDSLAVVLDQVSKEQIITLKTYGQKLNPVVMFFMIFGIIFPSLGIAFAIILFSFMGIGKDVFNSSILFLIFLGVGILQFLFLSYIESSRPRYSILE